MNIDIYQFKDYRKYLETFYVTKKKLNKHYSYAVFSQMAGLNSPNYLKRVMEGSRNITNKNLRNFILGLGLKKKEAQYFENLVMFNQSEAQDAKDFYFQEIKKMASQDDSAFKIDGDYYEYLSNWYYVAIHELVNVKGFKEAPAWIVEQLKNKVTQPQVKKALQLLLKIGFLKRGKEGKLCQVYPQINYQKDVRNLAIQKFHSQMIDLAKDSIAKEEYTKREPSSVTLCIDNKNFLELKKKIEDFREEINSKYSCPSGEGDSVVQVNFQLFSLTKERGGGSDEG